MIVAVASLVWFFEHKNSDEKYKTAFDYFIDNKKYPEDNMSSYTGYLSLDRIRFLGADFRGMKNALESNAKVTFHILEKDRLTTDYIFTIPENNNFKEISSGYFN